MIIHLGASPLPAEATSSFSPVKRSLSSLADELNVRATVAMDAAREMPPGVRRAKTMKKAMILRNAIEIHEHFLARVGHRPDEVRSVGPFGCHACARSDKPRLKTKVLSMFKFHQYRVQAAEYGKLVKSSADADESRKYQDLEDRFVSLANNERDLAEAYHDAVHTDEQDRTRGEVLAAEEEQVLRCLGAAVIMQWNTLPTSLQREIFDTAASVGKLWETAALRGQIARFLHKHKNESGRVKLPLTEDGAADARSGAAALSRWDNEGGAVRDGLPT